MAPHAGHLDAALGGGLARGQLHEIVAPAGAGGTALLRACLAAATQAGELCALVDPADSFDPRQPGIDLRRLLWVRPRDPVQALRAAEIALEARFALVALDLGDLPRAKARKGEVEVVRFSFDVVPALRLDLSAGALAPLVRDEFVFAPDGRILAVNAVILSGGLAASWRLP